MMLWQRKSNSTGLKRRIAYAFTLLIAVLALLCALAVKNAFEYAESTLTGEYMSDINETLLRTLDAGNSVTLPLAMTFYCDAPGLPPIPDRYKNIPLGYSEVADASPAVFAFRSSWKNYPLILVRDQDSFEAPEQKMWRILAITVIIIVILSSILVTILSRQIMRPVEELSNAVMNAASGSSYTPIPRNIMTHDEVGALAQVCDRTMSRLYDALKREKAFTGDVSHELRTPLTIIETSAELLEMSSLSQQQSRQVNRILRAVGQMSSLVTLFLQLARTERDIKGPSTDSVRELFSIIEETWAEAASQKNIKLSFTAQGHCKGRFSPVLLATVMNNLVKNALMYVSQGGQVAMIETSNGFIVADNGPGILPEDRDRIFEAFTRGNTACGSGEGLGLSIVSRICERMGWTARLLTEQDKPQSLNWATGAVFIVTLAGTQQRRSDVAPKD